MKTLTPRLAAVEIGQLAKIGAPLAAAYLAEMAMFITTKIVVGKMGYQELAAVGLASSITLELAAVLMASLSVVAVLVAQAEGRGDKPFAGHASRQGAILATLLGLAATWVVWHLDTAFAWLGQDPVVVALTAPYLQSVCWMVLPLLWFSVLRCFVSALARANSVMVITVVAVVIHAVLTIGLVQGRWNLPAMGLAGAGWATSIVTWGMFIALLAHTYLTPALRGYGLFKERLRVDAKVCREIVWLGLPVGGIVFLEAGLFAVASILSGILGAHSLAAYEILAGWLGMTFMLALGLAEGTMVRVALHVGRKAELAARYAGFLGMALGVCIVALLLIVPLGYPHQLIGLFLDEGDAGFSQVSEIALSIFAIAALFQVSDALQAIASRALRGLRDTVVPLWIAAMGYWVIGIGGGSTLTFVFDWQAKGLWVGLAAGLSTTGIALAWRFHRLTRRRAGLA